MNGTTNTTGTSKAPQGQATTATTATTGKPAPAGTSPASGAQPGATSTTGAPAPSAPPTPPATVSIAYVTGTGWPCTLTIAAPSGAQAIERAGAAIAALEAAGARPATQAQAVASAAQGEAEREAPVCKYHGAMRQSAKAPGTWYCAHRMGDGSYCKERA